MIDAFGGLTLGVLLGVKHAAEPDHLAAISTMVSRTRDPRRSAALGALWGLGHCVALVVFGGALVLTGTLVPPAAGACLELVVSVMLLVLGARSIARASRGCSSERSSTAGCDVRRTTWASRRAVAVGLVHGLAGTGMLTALALSQLPTAEFQVVYIALYGIGAAGGMTIVSGLAGASLSHRWARQFDRALDAAAGTASVICGVVWAAGILGELGAYP